MKCLGKLIVWFFALSFCCVVSSAQTPSTTGAIGVPRLVNFSGKATDVEGKPIAGIAGATFAVYQQQYEGAPLWTEMQNITADSKGNYTAQLGATKPEGLPLDLFASGEARWLGVTINGGQEQPRILLLSVPYALKAADAETVGGLPPSAFVLAAPANASDVSNVIATKSTAASTSASAPPAASSDVTTTGGTVNAIPLFSTATNIQNSLLTQTTTTAVNVAGKLNLPALGVATATAGKNSRPEAFVASAYNSGAAKAVPQTFLLQAEPAGNDTATSSATLNVLYASGTATPAETGLKINSKGLLTFATGQTFPGIGSGTITGITAGTDLTGGGTSGAVTLNLDTTKVPVLNATNAFTGNNSFSGPVGIGMTATRLFEVNAPGATSAEMELLTTGTDAAFSLNNLGSGGHEYWIDSGSGSAGAGAGNFAVWDNTDAAARLVVGPTGNVGIGTTVPGAGLSMAGGLTINGQGETLFSTQFQGVNSFAMNAASASKGNGWILYDYAPGNWTPGLIQEGGLVGIGTSPGSTALNVYDDNSDNTPFAAGGRGTCLIDFNGDLICTGSKNAAVPVDGGARWVAMSAIESPVNWFEDAGEADLLNGGAFVTLDPTYLQTVNTDEKYQVFLTPYGDCKGLYVTNRTASSFEVHELGGGVASLTFGYRIMAIRKNYETVRFADHTRDIGAIESARERMKTAVTKRANK